MPMPEYRSPILQPDFLPNFPVLYQSPNNPFCSSQGCSHEAQSNPNEPNLANTIYEFTQMVWKNQGSSNRSKVQELDVFDGSDTRKLWAFFVQCQLNFNSKPQAFQTNASKVNYAISYLKGTMLDWFKLGLMSDNPLDWISNYSKFTSKLKHNFGPHNPKGDTENVLKALQMKDNQRMVKYLVDFNCLTAWVTWGDSTLWHQLYKGLLNQIKDNVSWIRKPSTLSGMCQLIQQINACYWECQSEISWESKKSNNKSGNQKSNKSSNSASSSSKNQPSDNKSTSSSNKSPNPDLSSPSRQNKKPNLSNKLRKDGKLTSEEHAHWFANNLCMFCKNAGHKVSKCLKNTSSASKAKACAASTKEGCLLLWMIWKNRAQLQWLCMDQELHWTPPCTYGVKTQCICSFLWFFSNSFNF